MIQAFSRDRLLNKQRMLCHTSIIAVGGVIFYYWQTLFFQVSWSTAIIAPMVLGLAIVHGLSGRMISVLSQIRLGAFWVNHFCLAVSLLESASLIQLAARHFEATVTYSEAICAETPGVIRLVEDQYATTDLGTKIRLYRREVTEEDYAKFARYSALTIQGVTEKAMRRDVPSKSSNCHGWVFTGGNHILSSSDVPQVLNENGYRQVDTPTINDIVTYQDKDGIVIHTGVVRALYDGRIPMVESKWGMTAVYVHLVNEQPYSENHSFWRSNRSSHQLTTYRAAKFNLEMAGISSHDDLQL
jgi:hypothetical protein